MFIIYITVAVILFITRFTDNLMEASSSVPFSKTPIWRAIRALIWPLHLMIVIFSYIEAKKRMAEYHTPIKMRVVNEPEEDIQNKAND